MSKLGSAAWDDNEKPERHRLKISLERPISMEGRPTTSLDVSL